MAKYLLTDIKQRQNIEETAENQYMICPMVRAHKKLAFSMPRKLFKSVRKNGHMDTADMASAMLKFNSNILNEFILILSVMKIEMIAALLATPTVATDAYRIFRANSTAEG